MTGTTGASAALMIGSQAPKASYIPSQGPNRCSLPLASPTVAGLAPWPAVEMPIHHEVINIHMTVPSPL